jgi:hypothetical protein
VAEGACPYQGEVGRKAKVGRKGEVGHKGKVGRSHQPTWFVPTKCETAPHPAQRVFQRRTDPPQQPTARRASPRRVPRPPFGGEGARRAGEGENRPNHKALTRNTARLAGARTSVSAPLRWDRKRIVPLGSQAGSTAPLSPVPLSRPPAARTSVSAPLRLDRKTIEPLGSQKTRIGNPCVPHQEHQPAKPCPEGTFLDSPGFVRSTTLGCEAIIHFSPERAGLTEAAGMNRGLKSTSIVRVRSPTIGPVRATAASSEPLQGSGVSMDVPHLGKPLRVNPRLWKISPSGNGLGECRPWLVPRCLWIVG